jgi:hypothetical protein
LTLAAWRIYGVFVLRLGFQERASYPQFRLCVGIWGSGVFPIVQFLGNSFIYKKLLDHGELMGDKGVQTEHVLDKGKSEWLVGLEEWLLPLVDRRLLHLNEKILSKE